MALVVYVDKAVVEEAVNTAIILDVVMVALDMEEAAVAEVVALAKVVVMAVAAAKTAVVVVVIVMATIAVHKK